MWPARWAQRGHGRNRLGEERLPAAVGPVGWAGAGLLLEGLERPPGGSQGLSRGGGVSVDCPRRGGPGDLRLGSDKMHTQAFAESL